MASITTGIHSSEEEEIKLGLLNKKGSHGKLILDYSLKI